MLRFRGALFFGAVPLLFVAALVALFAAEDLPRELVELFFALDRLPLEREPLLRELLLRAPPLLDFPEPPLLDDAAASVDHLPLITRLAASATASAISEPNFVALESTDFAALSAVSAASMPASRIALRAFGLALIAAAAAARPAASISLLIAALASFSAVVLEEPEELEPGADAFELELAVFDLAPEERAPVLLLDLAIANLPLSAE